MTEEQKQVSEFPSSHSLVDKSKKNLYLIYYREIKEIQKLIENEACKGRFMAEYNVGNKLGNSVIRFLELHGYEATKSIQNSCIVIIRW